MGIAAHEQWVTAGSTAVGCWQRSDYVQHFRVQQAQLNVRIS